MKALLLGALVSMLPFVELRLGIPLAFTGAASPALIFFVCVAANIAIIAPLFLFLDYLHGRLLAIRWYKLLATKMLRPIRKKAFKVKRRMRIYGWLALTLFVSIPWPVTGAYTGTIIAWLLGLDRSKAFVAIGAGVTIAGIVVTLVALGIITTIRLA